MKHHWIIKDDENNHQIGVCKVCGEIKDFGLNPNFANEYLVISTEYYKDRYTREYHEYVYLEERGYEYEKPIDASGRYITRFNYGDQNAGDI